jgi:GT2 family glycosyltransferase
MRFIIDLIIINISAVFAFLLRENWLHFIKRLPSEHLWKYILALAGFNILYFFTSWLMGLYDKRQKRAMIEEFALIFAVFIMCLGVMIVFLFLGRLYWVSRIIVYLFLGSSIFLVCISRYLIKSGTIVGKSKVKYDLSKFEQKEISRSLEINLGEINKLSIVIVTYKHKDILSKCLDSLENIEKSISLEVVVVDNYSNDGTIELIKKDYPNVKIIENRENRGYSKAVNIGLGAITSDFSLIINPDIIITPGAVKIMLDYMNKNPKVGIAGCKLFNEDGSLQFSVRRFLDFRTYLYRFTPLRGLMAGSLLERRYLMQDWDHNDNRPVDWVLGGCMLVRKSMIEEVGLLDENIFMYFDDVDWCYRVWEKGWKVAYIGEAGMIHKHERTSANKIFNRATREHFKSLFYFLKKYGVRLPKNSPSLQE